MKFLINYTGSETEKKKNTGPIMRQLTTEEKQIPPDNLIYKFPNVKIFCDECQKSITMLTSVKAQQHDYCIGCFCQLEELPQNFHISNTIMCSLTSAKWSILDQLLLLTALEKWGFGNWEEIHEYMSYNGGKYTVQQIQEHYDSYYLREQSMEPTLSADLIKISYKQKENEYESMGKNKQAFSCDFKAKQKSNILGFNPKRGDFETEYDDKAQTIISDLQFKQTDTQEEYQYKLRLIEEYNRRLSQREKRKNFTLDHHILDLSYLFNQQYTSNRYEKEARVMIQPFTRFQTHQEHQQTVSLIAQTNQIKSLIGGLKKCRRKIDRDGKINNVINQIQIKEDIVFKNQIPRKIYHFEKSETKNEQELIAKWQKNIQKEEESENISLTIIQKME